MNLTREWSRWALVAALAATYYLVVLGGISESIERHGGLEADGLAALQSTVRGVERTHAAKVSALARQRAELESRAGYIRLEPPETKSPVKRLLLAIDAACKETGVSLKQVAPLPAVRSELLVLTGLQCELALGPEANLARFNKALRQPDRVPAVMIRQMRLSKGPDGILASLTLGLASANLAPVAGQPGPPPAGGDRRREFDAESLKKSLSELSKIESVRVAYAFDALLEPRPKPAPPPVVSHVVAPPPPPPRPAPRPAAPVIPAVEKFSGILTGVANLATGEPIALVRVGGEDLVLARGEKREGWTVESVEADHLVLKQGKQTQKIYFPEDEPAARPVPAAARPSPPAAAQAPVDAPAIALRGASLGFEGGFAPVEPDTLPAPFEQMIRAFLVRVVEPGGLADRAGLREGDRILTLGQLPLRVGGQIRSLRATLGSGKPVTIQVERGSMLLRLSLEG